MPAPPEILALLERFELHKDDYLSGNYNETQLRREFLDPVFKALGWDVDNAQGHAEAYKDVVHEDALRFAGGHKAPDYGFRIGGTRKFFVEAKKPAVNIKDDFDPAFQLRRYAWSAKLPLSILTDFDEWAVYDTRVRPSKDDKPSTARVLYLRGRELAERWDELAAIFSREAVLKGSFDKFAESSKRKKGTAEVDAAFLAEIEGWRAELAKNLALRNPKLEQRDLNFAVQRIIDRIIFLRIAEDRGIEEYGRLSALTNGEAVYRRLGELFRAADDRYNSGLFHFEPEKDRLEPPDDLTLGLAIDDKLLRDLIRGLYYPESPYEFSVLSADILGQVYEQFLGKVIKLTAGHRAIVEDKPEVKKAGGVYYTPTYIVDYIVRQTVGKLLEGKTPKQAAKLRILDPACGSGSFLIGAYQYLLDWHRDWYLADGPEKHTKELYRGAGLQPASPPLPLGEGRGEGGSKEGEFRLTTAERKRILLNNIYGVDIDPQAVEVTKLSLLLKVLEGASRDALERQRRFLHERALPDLGGNIKCGNSLIGPDFYDGQQMSLFDEEEKYRLNVFDWSGKDGFAPIMKSGGFDAVIGNPPYVRIQTMKEYAPLEVEFLKDAYSAAGVGNYDIYVVFVERALSLVNNSGVVGFILPHKFFNSQYGQPLRECLAAGGNVSEIVHFGHNQVFVGATTYTCLLFLSKAKCKSFSFHSVGSLDAWSTERACVSGEIPIARLTSGEWNLTVGPSSALHERLASLPIKLGDVADVFVGVQTSADDVFIMDFIRDTRNTITLHSKALEVDCRFEREMVHPIVSGTDVDGYSPLPARQFVLFPYVVESEQATLIDWRRIKDDFPLAAEYLAQNRKRLESRERGKFRDEHWYRFGRNQNIGIQGKSKLCVPRLVEVLHCGFDRGGERILDNVDVGGVTIKPDKTGLSLPYLLALLNSRLLAWYFPAVSAPFRGGWRSANRQFLSQLPIIIASDADKTVRKRIDAACQLVEQMLTLHAELAKAKTGHAQTVIQRQIDATDRQIDQLVYQLYGLTDAEIALVEGANT